MEPRQSAIQSLDASFWLTPGSLPSFAKTNSLSQVLLERSREDVPPEGTEDLKLYRIAQVLKLQSQCEYLTRSFVSSLNECSP